MEHSARAGREQGAALLLTFLVLMILVVVIGQLSVSSSVDRSIALHSTKDVEFEYAARGGLEIAKSLLIKDLKDEEEQSQSGQGGGSGLGGGDGGGDDTGGTGDTGGSGDTGGGDPFGSGGEGEESQAADSMDDEWADDQKSREQFGDNIDVRIRIVDEDRKFNLLGLVAEDAKFRATAKDRFTRLIDMFREDSKHDLSAGDGKELADSFEKWFQGQRDKDFPVPRQSTEKTEDSKLAWSEERFKEKQDFEVVYPLGLDELVYVDGMTEFILKGFIEGDRYVPGLEDVVTVFSNLRFDEEALEEDEEEEKFENPFDQKEEEENEEDDRGAGEAPGAQADSEQATETNQGRVNINTAPLCVLRCLLESHDLPLSVLEKVDEFRRELFEEQYEKEKDPFGSSTEDGDKWSFDDKDDEDDDGREDDDEADRDKEDYIFQSPEAALGEVADYYNTSFNLTEAVEKEFAESIAVKSNVFTILLELRYQKGGGEGGSFYGEEYESPPDRVYRAVVWRRKGGEDEYQCITLVPLHPWTGVLPPSSEDYTQKFPLGF